MLLYFAMDCCELTEYPVLGIVGYNISFILT